jgi:hypothetical protein
MKFILSLLISTTLLVDSAFALGQARIYGAPNTFGSLPDWLSSGQALSKIPDNNLALPPGRTPFFMASTSDGTVFSATFHQNGNNGSPTSCYMTISCVNPSSPVCYDESSNTAKNYSTIYVKARDGYRVPGNNETPCLTPSTTATVNVLGADITDIQRVVDSFDGEHVAFMSTMASLTNYPLTAFPALGFISKISGSWRLNPSKQYWRDQIAASGSLGSTVCPGTGYGTSCGFGEMAFLPQSRRLVIGFYFKTTPALAVFDLNGTAIATYSFNAPGNRCTADPNDTLELGTRQVDVDPTAPYGDERIAITLDASLPFNHPIQEFSYNDRTKALVPKTNFVNTISGSDPLPDCSPQGQNANYDKYGNLVVGAYSGSPVKAIYHVYFKDKVTRKRSIEVNCPFTGYTEQNHARGCMADLSVGEFTGLTGSGYPKWSYVFHNTNTEFDPASSVLARLNGGAVNLIDDLQVRRSPVFVTYNHVNLDADLLPQSAPHIKSIIPWKGTLQAKTQTFWTPLATTLDPVIPGCSPIFWCERYTNEWQPGWFYELKYNEIMDAQLRVRSIKSTARKVRKFSTKTFKFIFKTNQIPVVLDPVNSGFWLFPRTSGQAVYRADVIADGCSATGCSYRVRFPQSDLHLLADGDYRWSAVLKGLNTDDLVHAQGVIPISG